MYRFINLFILPFFLFLATSFINPFAASHCSIKNGYYSPPSKRYQCLYPLGDVPNETKWLYCEKSNWNKNDRAYSVEKTTFLFKQAWKIAGFWHTGFIKYKTKKADYNVLKDAQKQSLYVAHYYLHNNAKMISKNNVVSNGFPAIQIYYEGLSPEKEPAGMMITVIDYEDACGMVSLIFPLDDSSPSISSNPFVKKYHQVVSSFKRL